MLALSQAGALLRAGGILFYPTETLWAIGCAADNAAATAAVCAIKHRPPGKPLPLIAATISQAAGWLDMDSAPADLIARFWPGPLTLVLPIKKSLAPDAINSQHKAAARVSASPCARALANMAGCPIVATSANLADKAPAREAGGLAPELLSACEASGLPWGILASPCQPAGGAPSTLVEPLRSESGWRLKILREGAIKKSDLRSPDWELV